MYVDETGIPEIGTRDELIELARTVGLRPDWHEPDEQDFTARVEGTPYNFDNAMGARWYGSWRKGEPARAELHVIFSLYKLEYVGDEQERVITKDLAKVNLATLCSWAAGHQS